MKRITIWILCLTSVSLFAADNLVDINVYKSGTTATATLRANDNGDGTYTLHVYPEGGAGTSSAITAFRGAANYANGQVTASTTAATLKAANSTRRSIAIKNIDSAITIYVGGATVTASNGMPLKAGESISIDTTALIQVIAASGSPVVAYFETYD
jgi:hypothetical protein